MSPPARSDAIHNSGSDAAAGPSVPWKLASALAVKGAFAPLTIEARLAPGPGNGAPAAPWSPAAPGAETDAALSVQLPPHAGLPTGWVDASTWAPPAKV